MSRVFSGKTSLLDYQELGHEARLSEYPLSCGPWIDFSHLHFGSCFSIAGGAGQIWRESRQHRKGRGGKIQKIGSGGQKGNRNRCPSVSNPPGRGPKQRSKRRQLPRTSPFPP